ncbi:MAG: nucleotide exchange factor GrpE [Chlamydiales bacterium]|nr:nucleotide exchange factor GrpE [Chlamydiales bacterium]
MPEEEIPESLEETSQKVEELPKPDQEIDQLKESLKESQEKYLRVLADSENARKRMQKEREEMTKYAIENVLTEFLHPIDNLEKALLFAESMSDEVRNWAVGFEMLLNQFKQILVNHGVEEYHSVGKHFDPHLHEAVEMVETTEYEPGVVVEEFVRGYRKGDRPIRVARVKVAKAPEEKDLGEKS